MHLAPTPGTDCRLAAEPDERLREKEFGILDRLTVSGIRDRHPEQAEFRRLLARARRLLVAGRDGTPLFEPVPHPLAPSVLFEPGAAKKIAGLVSEFGAKRVLFVTDKGVRGAGLTQDAEASLAAASELTVFEDVVADPPSHVVEAAVSLCREKQVEAVVSIGGGSALDTAKLVAYLARSDDRLDAIYGVGLAQGQRLPLLLAPTTAGTGSEVTPIAIVTTPTTEKKGVVSPSLLPDWAILDPELTLGLPPHVTAATGIDAMVHAIIEPSSMFPRASRLAPLVQTSRMFAERSASA